MVNLTYGWFLSIFAPILWRQARPTIIVFRRNPIKLLFFSIHVLKMFNAANTTFYFRDIIFLVRPRPYIEDTMTCATRCHLGCGM